MCTFESDFVIMVRGEFGKKFHNIISIYIILLNVEQKQAFFHKSCFLSEVF